MRKQTENSTLLWTYLSPLETPTLYFHSLTGKTLLETAPLLLHSTGVPFSAQQVLSGVSRGFKVSLLVWECSNTQKYPAKSGSEIWEVKEGFQTKLPVIRGDFCDVKKFIFTKREGVPGHH